MCYCQCSDRNINNTLKEHKKSEIYVLEDWRGSGLWTEPWRTSKILTGKDKLEEICAKTEM